ncbi:NupC/NupG family nucleoside CNT transporter [Salegentibacter salarius]|uniref:Na+ dependent nucleoside transporter n=2 Tax=Salegentibacter salarius TaxID=435906 RepID=A0A2N0TRX9_9FLAO|nr:nucleoside transporter C-terminal domain-containing protein [Salegentibacter salarius]OEY71899.1 Na+ dependent nucleoside transporter [Salegentibacter salarius]PKD17490.1 Na+ dependent nucleoside transporter [Salegentibacter salarius]SLJ89271.1 concentrative nucleoside transporter, CNT family [Salegentibacter salarius]
MNKTWFCLILVLLSVTSTFSQNISKTWTLDEEKGNPDQEIFSDGNTLSLNEGLFSISKAEDTLAKGDYIFQNKLLVLFYNTPQDSIVNYRVSALTDSSMAIMQANRKFHFKAEAFNDPEEVIPAPIVKEMIPSAGISFSSIWRGALGMSTLLLIAFLFSSNRKAINWKTIGIGLSAQLLLAVGVLKITFIQKIFEFVGNIFVLILDFTAAGSEFLLGGMMDVESFGFIFLFQVLPTIIFFSALTSVLFYLGVIQIVVKGLAWVLTKLLGISGAESLSVAGNIFLGQTEAPLMIKAYLERMTRSEILLVMIGGMATVAGGVLAAYIGFLGGDDPELRLQFAKHLLAASVMAAPGAIVVSKILYPQQNKINTNVDVSSDKIGSNILDAIANGTTEGLKLAANVAAMLLVFIAFIAMINYVLNWTGSWTGLNAILAENTPYSGFSLESILGIIFAPLMWLIGVAKEDMMLMGQLLGIKLAASEFVGYVQLADLKNTANALSLNYEKSVIMATYMLCGFANFASIGIQIGGIGSLAPGQRKTLSEFGMKALIGGTIASLLSATLAGMIIG